MNTYFWRFLLCSTVVTTTISAQQTAIYTHDLAAFDKGVNLYQNSQYQSARIIFGKIISENTNKQVKSDCAYYIASCAIRLNHSDAEILIDDFIDTYPENSKSNQIIIDAAFYYFNQGQYPNALKWFEKVDETNLTQGEREQLNFQKGYCYFVAKNEDEATKYFNKTINSKNYGSKSKYYLGFMAYKKNDYTTAKKLLEQAAKDPEYTEKVEYLLADIYFNLKEFQTAIDLGLKQIDKSKPNEKADLSKIIGESYFNLGKYEKAIPYLEGYSSKYNKWNNTDYYQLGYAYYKAKEYEKAISQFNKIIEEKNAVTQNAYYHLGESYLKLDKKQEAFNAFKNASEMDFELKIQEDAYYNYAKLSYELGNPYLSVPEVLQAFVAKYPNTPHHKEIETLLISSYVSSKNYKEAIRLLEKAKSNNNDKIYQKVTYLYGIEQFNNNDFKESLVLFNKSLSTPINQLYVAKATFWKAESLFVMDNYNESIENFKQFSASTESKNINEFANVNYNIAYGYFKLKKYPEAIEYFQKYIDTKPADKRRLNDAYLRLGDSYYVTAKYWIAMEAYNKAIGMDGIDGDYASYQKAMCYSYVDRNEKKIEDLTSFSRIFPKSKYIDDATFELANAYSATNKTNEAIATYDKLIKENSKSLYVSKSLLRQALIYFNQEKDNEALVKLKKVTSDFPGTPESLEAVATAKLIYLDLGKVDEYAKWVKTLSFVNVSDAELDNLTYEAAEKQYLQNNVKESIKAFEGYVAQFPKGIHSLTANFYLAQSYYASGADKKTIPHYEFVIDKPTNEFTEQSLARLSQILLKNKEYAKAIPVLLRLEKEASFSQNITFAESNLMKSYYEEKNYPEAVVYAEKVMSKEKSDAAAKSDGQVIIARSAMKSGDETKARSAYSKLAGSKGELGAEVLFYDAYFKNKDGKFEDSNKTIQKIAKDFSGYKYYGAKSLVVMANNFYNLKDTFQATYVLETVITNFATYKDVVEEAKTALQKIKDTEEKQTPTNNK